jgi:hypothetical protein
MCHLARNTLDGLQRSVCSSCGPGTHNPGLEVPLLEMGPAGDNEEQEDVLSLVLRIMGRCSK